MYYEEMKKIWKPGTVALILGISILLFVTFMLRCIRPFQYNDGSESTGMTLELCRDFMEQYGNTIEAEEFAAIEGEYRQLLDGTNEMISQTELFMQNGITDYEEYFQYMQKAILGYEGYDYNTYAKMRELIIQETGKSSMYFEIYEDFMEQYQSATAGRTSILPFEILSYTNDYFVVMILWCLICTFFLSAPVMVADRANHMTANQYAGKRGKKIHKIQYRCMNVSVLILVSMITLVSMLLWNTTGALEYRDSGINSFLNSETSVIPLTYGGLILCFIVSAYFLTFGITKIVFYLSSRSSNAINLLIKAIPVLVGGCFIGLFVSGLLCESNRIYQILPIPGCELILVAAVFVTGVFINGRNYRMVRRRDA